MEDDPALKLMERNFLSEGPIFKDRGLVIQIHPPGSYPDGLGNVLYVPYKFDTEVDISFVYRQKQNTAKRPCAMENKIEKGYMYTPFDTCRIRASKRAMFDRCQCCYRNVPSCSGLPETPCFPLQTLAALQKQANSSKPPTGAIARILCAFNFTESFQSSHPLCKSPCNSYEYSLSSYGKKAKRNSGRQTITFRATTGEKPLFVGESLAYTEVDLLSDIGGAMCLCLGCSIITLLEFFELPFLSAYRRCGKSL